MWTSAARIYNHAKQTYQKALSRTPSISTFSYRTRVFCRTHVTLTTHALTGVSFFFMLLIVLYWSVVLWCYIGCASKLPSFARLLVESNPPPQLP